MPRVLTVTRTHLAMDWLAGHRMRHREWPADRVRTIDWRPVTHIFSPRATVVRVTIWFATGRPLRFTLGSRELASVERGRLGLNELLGRGNCIVAGVPPVPSPGTPGEG